MTNYTYVKHKVSHELTVLINLNNLMKSKNNLIYHDLYFELKVSALFWWRVICNVAQNLITSGLDHTQPHFFCQPNPHNIAGFN